MKHTALCVISLLLLSLAVGCNNNASTTGGSSAEWDSANGVYSMPDLNCTYNVHDYDHVVVADPINLPEGVNMCLVDTMAHNSISIFCLEKSVSEPLSHNAVQDLVANIVKQAPDVRYVVKNQSIEPDSFMKSSAWRFKSNLTLYISGDSLSVSYGGLIFNVNDKIASFVVTTQAPYTSLDSIIDSYSASLRPHIQR